MAGRRPDLSNRALRLLVGGLVAAIGVYLIIKPGLPAAWHRPGSEVLQSLAALGGLLLLVPFAFSLGKRGGMAEVPNKLFILHVGASVIGIFLVFVHAVAAFEGPPLFMVAFLIGLVITGAYGRVHLSARMAATFGTKPRPFQAPDEAVRAELRRIIDQKIVLLKSLEPSASEALFSVTPKHLLTRPFQAVAYLKLVRREEALMGTRQSVSAGQAWWRPLHMLLAWAFLAGLILHVVLVIFFAVYVAEGREIYWWHLASW